jgi:hypothetical protein
MDGDRPGPAGGLDHEVRRCLAEREVRPAVPVAPNDAHQHGPGWAPLRSSSLSGGGRLGSSLGGLTRAGLTGRMRGMRWVHFIQVKILPWAPIAAIIGVLAYDAFFVCKPLARECRYPVDANWKADYSRGCAYGVRGLPSCDLQ